MPGLCACCGACCRVVSLDLSKTELRALAAHEHSRLQQHPDHPHADGMRRLVRDIAFIQQHFRRISRRRAVTLNPRMASSDFDERCFYVCDALGDDGLCSRHTERPFVCEGYPWYHGRPNRALLVAEPCGYATATPHA